MVSTPQDQSQSANESSMTKQELSKVQAVFNRACAELDALQAKMRGADFTMEDMQRLEYLQPVVIQSRKQMGLLQAKAQAAEESSQQVATTKRRTDDQGMRERGTKHRTLEMTHKGTTGDGNPKSSPQKIGDVFKKGVQEVLSSSPSSAARTPTPIPVVFKESASSLPVEKESRQDEVDPTKPLILPPTNPRSLKLASDIRRHVEKLKKSDQTTPSQRSGDTTAKSTPSSGFDITDQLNTSHSND